MGSCSDLSSSYQTQMVIDMTYGCKAQLSELFRGTVYPIFLGVQPPILSDYPAVLDITIIIIMIMMLIFKFEYIYI